MTGHVHLDPSTSGATAGDAGATGPSADAAPTRWWIRVAIAPIRFYQHARAGRPSPCRYDPSCSSYAVESLQLHGVVKGSWLAVRRISRCHPWGGQGYDPVPAPARHEHPAAPLPRDEKVR